MFSAKRYPPLLAALFISCFFIIACENDEKKLDALFTNRAAVEEAFTIESFMSQSGKVKAKLTAPYMMIVQGDSPYVEFPRTVHVDFYSDSITIESVMDAHYAKHFQYNGKVLLRDSVVVINKNNGDTLRTNELWWDRDKREFRTDKPVQIYQKDKTIFGRGLWGLQDFSKYSLDTITGIVLVPPDDVPQ
ncbi:MAG: LPS export ABC transporter periplasmic protein LptC [Chitinophagaceae bacterium]|nr:LPS export ABC transporter periplasmic protein LptC [Chitinophagaceae bacterium]